MYLNAASTGINSMWETGERGVLFIIMRINWLLKCFRKQRRNYFPQEMRKQAKNGLKTVRTEVEIVRVVVVFFFFSHTSTLLL